jgi:hypothetical protein
MAQDGVPVRGNSAPLGWLTKDAILKGSYWPEAISVITDFESSHGFVTVEAVRLHTRQHHQARLYPVAECETPGTGDGHAPQRAMAIHFIVVREMSTLPMMSHPFDCRIGQ